MARTPTNSDGITSENGNSNSSIDNIPAAGPEGFTSDSAQDVDVILAEVLRIFAARGRAIREARTKLDAELSQGSTGSASSEMRVE